MEQLIFYVFGATALAAALVVVLQQRAVHSALALIVCFASLAVLFFQLGAPFVAAIQIIIYAGAIMVLFLFVIMLLDPQSEAFSANRLKKMSLLALPVAAILAFVLLQALPAFSTRQDATPAMEGRVEVIAPYLFKDYLLPFEVTSILILAAVAGAVILARPSD